MKRVSDTYWTTRYLRPSCSRVVISLDKPSIVLSYTSASEALVGRERGVDLKDQLLLPLVQMVAR